MSLSRQKYHFRAVVLATRPDIFDIFYLPVATKLAISDVPVSHYTVKFVTTALGKPKHDLLILSSRHGLAIWRTGQCPVG